jgi:hypothetical protein
MGSAKQVDPAVAAEQFIIRDEVHEPMHDRFLWAVMQRRNQEAGAIPEWEELREIASKIKEHTLTHLDHYVEEFEANATKRGAQVHWALDAAEHNEIVYSILEDYGVKELIKSKSMLQEECGMTPYLEHRGIKVIESDLGERIQQLDGQPPSHIVFPAIHKTRQDVAQLFARTIGTDPNKDDPHFLTEVMRNNARPSLFDDRALVADPAGDFHRVPRSPGEPALATALEHRIWLCERGAGARLWHSARQHRARRTAGFRRILFSTVVDKLEARWPGGDRRLVHALGGARVIPRFGSSWLPVGGLKDRRKLAGANALVRCKVLAAFSCHHAVDVGSELFHPAEHCQTVPERTLGCHISGSCRRRYDRHTRAKSLAGGSECVFGIRTVPNWNADQCGIRSFSQRAAVEHHSKVESYGLQCRRRRAWTDRRIVVVRPRHGPCDRIFGLRLPAFRRQSGIGCELDLPAELSGRSRATNRMKNI